MKVLGIGESIIDIVHTVEDNNIVPASSRGAKQHVGGPVLSALIVLSRLGVDTTLVTSLGRDAEAKIVKKVLKHEKVKLLYKIQHKTKVNTILVDKHTGKRNKLRGETVHIDIKNLSRNFIRQFDVIIMDRHEKTAFYAVLKMKKPSTKIVIDPSVEVSTFTMDMMKHADYPIIPIESLFKICSGNSMACLTKLYSLIKKPITITASEFGSLIYDGVRLQHVLPYDIKVVDDLGAGDVYRGAFTYGITQHWDLSQCALFGNYVAALQCTKPGNVAAIPTKEEMTLFMILKTLHTGHSGAAMTSLESLTI
jgi:sugar/nucleoside kinase (ribokinase family)